MTWSKSEIEGAKYPMMKTGTTLYRHDCPKCGHSVALLHNEPVLCSVCPLIAQARAEQRKTGAAKVRKTAADIPKATAAYLGNESPEIKGLIQLISTIVADYTEAIAKEIENGE